MMIKKIVPACIGIFLVISLFSGAKVSADEGKEYPKDMYSVTQNADDVKLVKDLLEKYKVNDKVNQSYQAGKGEGKAFIDPNIFVIAYYGGSNYALELSRRDENFDKMFTSGKTSVFYIVPIFNDHNRVAGHVEIKYNLSEKDYYYTPHFLNVGSADFKEGRQKHYLEGIETREAMQKYADEDGLGKVERCVFIDSSSVYNGQAIYIKTDKGEYMYSSGLMNDNLPNNKAYPLAEYIQRKAPIEQERLNKQHVDENGNLIAGGNGGIAKRLIGNIVGNYQPVAIVILVFLGIAGISLVTVLAIRKQSKKLISLEGEDSSSQSENQSE